MINEERIKAKVIRAIAIKPTHITLLRTEFVSNGMRGTIPKEVQVGELDVFIDDSKHNYVVETIAEPGSFKKARGITMLAAVDGIAIKDDDYFTTNGIKYRITYPGKIVKDVYNADLEVIK